MPSWEKLQELGAQVATHLPGTWDLREPPPFWEAILERTDAMVRILIDDRLSIVAQVSSDGHPLPPMGRPNTAALHNFRTRLRDPEKIALTIARKLNL